MGGYLGALWWTFPLDDDLLQLATPALELMAVGINFVMFSDVISQLIRAENNVVVAFIDAQASPQLLVKRGTTSPVMSRVLNRIRNLPQYVKLKGKVAVAHTFGEGNDASDDTSRGKFDELRAYCLQTGVKDRKLDIHSEVHSFVQGILTDLREDGVFPSKA